MILVAFSSEENVEDDETRTSDTYELQNTENPLFSYLGAARYVKIASWATALDPSGN